MRNRWWRRCGFPRALLAALVLTLLSAGSAVVPGIAARAAVIGPGSFVSEYGEAGAPVRSTRVWHSASSTITPTFAPDGSRVGVSMAGGAGTAGNGTISFSVPSGQALAVGDYTAVRTPGQSAAGAALDISDSYCPYDYRATFSILELATETAQISIRYEIRCGQSPLASFGEVRVNQPSDPDVLVTGRQVVWPMRDPTVKGATVPIHVVNTGPRPLTLGEVAITAGRTDFVTMGDGCSRQELPPNAECRYEVSFIPSTGGERAGRLTVSDGTGTVRGTVELGGRGSPGLTQFKVYDQGGDYSPAGTVRSFGYGQVSASGGPTALRFSGLRFPAGPPPGTQLKPGDIFAVEIATGGPRLAVGTYDDAEDRYDRTRLRLEAGGYSTTCREATGSFTISKIAFDPEDQLATFTGQFEIHCHGRAPALYGSIAYRADEPAPPVAHAPPSAVSSPVAAGGLDSVRLSWVNPTDGDFDHVVVSKYSNPAGDGQPPGRVVYRGAGNSVTIGGLGNPEGATTDYFYITPVNTVRASGPTTVLRTTRIAINSSYNSEILVRTGGSIDLAGSLSLAYQREPAAGFRVEVARVLDGVRGSALAHAVTDSTGSYRLRFAATTNARYVTYFPGAPGYVGAMGRAVDVTVTPALSAKPDRSSGALGTTFRIAVSCKPSAAGGSVHLQRWNGKSWSTLTTTKLAGGSATMAVKPTVKGTARYRVSRPATATYGAANSAEFSIKTT